MQRIFNPNFRIVIPARWRSSRFPGKPLAMIAGKTMIERVWEACAKSVNTENILIATDNNKIQKFCKKKKMNVCVTSRGCLTGTDRIIEVAKKVKTKIYINVQGDEPLIDPREITKFIKKALNEPNQIYIAKSTIDKRGFLNKNLPKIVTNNKNELLYISRSSIPGSKKNIFKKAYGQVNIYSYPRKVLIKKEFKNKKTFNEKIEDIEILRFLEKGYNIRVLLMNSSTHPVDTKDDIKIVERILKK